MTNNQTKRNQYIRKRVQKKFLPPGTTEKYIQNCSSFNKTIKDQPKIVFEKHHIIPRFAGGTNDPENIVLLTPRQHILVHLLRYLELGKKQDFAAYILRKASKDVDLSSHGKRMAEFNKQDQTTFWDPQFQSEQGKKGGKKGGSAKTPLQQKARSEVGTKWGPIVGMSNQSDHLKYVLSHVMVFSHKEGVQVVVPVCKTASAVFDYVHNEMVALGKEHLFSKELVKKAKGGGPMYGLIRGKKKKIHGWSIIDRIPPSEFSD